MTTIAYKNGIMAADRRGQWGSFSHPVTELRRLSDGSIAAGSGEMTFILQMFAWLDAGAKPESFPADQRDKEDWQPILVVTPAGEIRVYERTPYPVVSEGTMFALGSGRDFAMMAMHLGKSAPEAVRLTSEFDPGTGSEVDTLTIPQPLQEWQRNQPDLKLHRPESVAEQLRDWRHSSLLARQHRPGGPLNEPGNLVPARA